MSRVGLRLLLLAVGLLVLILCAGTSSSAGCDGVHKAAAGSFCGDGIVTFPEQCDDNDNVSGDGCSNVCEVEPGWNCAGSPSICTSTCGDGIVTAVEECDDGGFISGDGCSSMCEIEPGWVCTGSPSTCTPIASVGGIAGLAGPAGVQLQTTHASGPSATLLAALATGAVASIFVLTAAGWYAVRRVRS